MPTLNVALLQLRSCGADPERALREGERACREAAKLGAHVALFPEMWQIGYARCPADEEGRARWKQLAVDADGPFVSRFRELARELGLAVVVTYLQRWPGGPRNAATLVDRRGRLLLTYAKVHTCAFDTEAELTPGTTFEVATLEFAPGESVAIGLMTCYDREFPESARVLTLKGAEVVLTPNSCHLDDERIFQFRARAYENMVGVAMANYAREDGAASGNLSGCAGRSCAFDGICYDGGTPRDQTLVLAHEEEGIHVASFDLDALRTYRRRQVWGAAHRQPHAYRILTEPSAQDSSRSPG